MRPGARQRNHFMSMMDLVLLVQTTMTSLVSRAAAHGRTHLASRPGAAARAGMLGAVRASLAALLLLQLAACSPAPALPVAGAADSPPLLPTPSEAPTALPTPVPTSTAVPTLAPTPTLVP